MPRVITRRSRAVPMLVVLAAGLSVAIGTAISACGTASDAGASGAAASPGPSGTLVAEPSTPAAAASLTPSFEPPAEPAAAAVEVDGEPLATLEDPAEDPAVGARLPGLAGTSTAGEPMTIGPDDGPMAILVVAHWCPHCQSEVALLSDHLRVNGVPEDIRVVAVSTAIDPTRDNYPSSVWLANAEWPIDTLVDDADNTALHALGIPAFPGLVLVDADGNVTLRVTGGLNGSTFDQGLDTLRGG